MINFLLYSEKKTFPVYILQNFILFCKNILYVFVIIYELLVSYFYHILNHNLNLSCKFQNILCVIIN